MFQLRSIALTAALLLSAGASSAEEASKAQPAPKAGKAKAATPAPKPKLSTAARMGDLLVDLNRATKERLLTLPGLTPVQADKIIKARPILSKANLVTKGIMDAAQYATIKDRVTAKQRPSLH